MAFDQQRFKKIQPMKVGFRQAMMENAQTGEIEQVNDDILSCGDDGPSMDNFMISHWEMGTLNYEALAGFTACVDQYLMWVVAESDIEENQSKSASVLTEVAFQKLNPTKSSFVLNFWQA